MYKREILNKKKLTDKKACIKSALTLANTFPFTRMVNVSSFSVVIKLPNHDFFVSSGEESGVRCTCVNQRNTFYS